MSRYGQFWANWGQGPANWNSKYFSNFLLHVKIKHRRVDNFIEPR